MPANLENSAVATGLTKVSFHSYPKERQCQRMLKHTLVGEGNGTPLQHSCLENPMDRGAWWAAVHGVIKSRTRLATSLSLSLSCIGEGNGNPLQCSCLENPRDGGAWWAAVYGVTKSRTWLTRLSSSNRTPKFHLCGFYLIFSYTGNENGEKY